MISLGAAALLGAACVSALMGALWVLGRRIANMAVVDLGWTLGLGFLGVLYACASDAPDARRLLIGGAAALWSVRLAIHLLRDRVLGREEEGRYRELRRRWSPGADRAFFWFFQAQGLLDVVLSAPFYLAVRNTTPSLSLFEIGALGLLLVSVAGEGIADRQLAQFKANPANRGKVCRTGLWAVSRHPNYFFEWLVWCAFALLAWPAPWGAAALVCPAMMLYFILRVTGIPETEAQAIRSRGEEYRRYQREVSPFFPWFPRSSAASSNSSLVSQARP